jgi:hypothetical protein
MKRFALVLAAIALTSCTKKPDADTQFCRTVSKAVTAASLSVSGALACSNPVAIAEDLTEVVQGLGLCKEQVQATGPIGTLVCPALVGFVAKTAVNQIPQAWECTGGPLTDAGKAALLEACVKYLP